MSRIIPGHFPQMCMSVILELTPEIQEATNFETAQFSLNVKKRRDDKNEYYGKLIHPYGLNDEIVGMYTVEPSIAEILANVRVRLLAHPNDLLEAMWKGSWGEIDYQMFVLTRKCVDNVVRLDAWKR